MPAPLVIALHGSSHSGAVAYADELAGAVAGVLPGVEVASAFVDRRVRTLGEQASGTIVVPAFLTAGYHVRWDVPGAVGSAGVTITQHVGPSLASAVADRIVEAGGPGDAILLAAAGSRQPSANAETARLAGRLWRLFGVPVRVGYLYADTDTVEDVAATLEAAGYADITVATFFLGPGLYAGRLDALGVSRVSSPIGVHPDLVDAVAARYRRALGAQSLRTVRDTAA